MSEWAGIESSSPVQTRREPADHASRFGAGGQPVAMRRVRRHQRPVVGSLDGAGTLIQRNARELVLGSAFIIVPSVALNLVATSLAFDRYRSFRGSAISIPEVFGAENSTSSLEDLLWYVGLMTSNLVSCLVGGFVATLVVRRQLGQPMRIRSGYRAMLPRLPALLVAWAIGHCWFALVGLILATVERDAIGAAITFGGPVVMAASTMTLCVAPAIVIERLGPFRGLRRAWQLAARNFGVLFAFVGASAVLGTLVQYGVAYLPRLMQGIGLLSFGRFGWLVEGVAGQLGRLLSTPLVAVATVLVYLEMRMSTEGMDIVLDADAAFGARS